MNVLKIERHPFRYQLMAYFILPIVGLSGIWLFYLSLQDYLNGISEASVYWGWIGGILLIIASVFFLVRLLRKVPSIIVEKDQGRLWIGKDLIKAEDIQQLENYYSLGQANFRLFEGSQGIQIHSAGKEEFRLDDTYYKNLDELKWWLFQEQKGKQNYPPEVKQVDSSLIVKKDVDWIKSSLFGGKSFVYLAMILVMLGLTAFQYFLNGVGLITFIFLIMTLLSYISFGNQTNYFGFTGKYFIVRNFLSRARSENWRLGDIKKAVINRKNGVSYMIIEFKDYTYRSYMSIVLDDQASDLLIRKLMDKKIEIVQLN